MRYIVAVVCLLLAGYVIYTNTSTEVIPVDDPIIKETLVCERVCNWNQELVNYAWELTHDMEFILTITQESKWDRKAIGAGWEDGLCQWTDVWSEFKSSREFANPHRQIDKCWEQFQRRRADGVVWFQLKGYKVKEKWASYFQLVEVIE